MDLLSIEKLIQFDCCKGHLNKFLIDQKHVYVDCLFGTGWLKGFMLQILVKEKPGANKKIIAIITTPKSIMEKYDADNHWLTDTKELMTKVIQSNC